jgi:hypothetical protein
MKKPPPRPKREKKPAAPGVVIINIPMPINLTIEAIEVQTVRILGLLAQPLPLSDQAELYTRMATRCRELSYLARQGDG